MGLTDRSTTIIAVSLVLAFLATFSVVGRFWARRVKHAKLGVDDALIVLALILTLGVVAINIVAATWSRIGQHEIMYTSGPRKGTPEVWQIRRQSITLYSNEILYACAISAVKACALAFYLRIFISRPFRIAVYVVGAYVFAWWVAILFTTIFQCSPVGPIATLDSKCIDALLFFRASAILNLVSDVVVILMPIPVVLKLKSPMSHKLAVVGIFLTTSLVVVAGIGRVVVHYTISHDHDYSWHDFPLIMWSSVEPCMGVIGVCLPAIRQLFAGYSPESVLGSIRSALSVRSRGSVSSKDSSRGVKTKESTENMERIPSTSNQSREKYELGSKEGSNAV